MIDFCCKCNATMLNIAKSVRLHCTFDFLGDVYACETCCAVHFHDLVGYHGNVFFRMKREPFDALLAEFRPSEAEIKCTWSV